MPMINNFVLELIVNTKRAKKINMNIGMVDRYQEN